MSDPSYIGVFLSGFMAWQMLDFARVAHYAERHIWSWAMVLVSAYFLARFAHHLDVFF
jgi:hypothetical protein